MTTDNLPPPDTNNLWYCHHESDEVLVFVHGILSDSLNCWLARDKHGTPVAYWPSLIASDSRFRNIGIYLGGYHTSVNSGDFPIQQCAAELLSFFKTTDSHGRPPVLSKKKITFVCHSMGGIVVRDLLCEHRDEFKEKTIGIVLVASPSYGSKLQNSLDHVIYLYNHEQGKQLRWASETLRLLDDRFKNLKDGNKIKSLSGVEFFENRFIIHYKWLPWFSRTKVVSQESAVRYFGFAKMVGGSDHMSICKPRTVAAPVHQYLLEFLLDKDLLPAPAAACAVHAADRLDAPETRSIADPAAMSGVPVRNGNTALQGSAPVPERPVSRVRRDVTLVLADFHSSDPVKGSSAFAELLDLKDSGEAALFAQPLSIRTVQVRRRMLEYVAARAPTVTPRLLAHLQQPERAGDPWTAAVLLSGLPTSTHVVTEIKRLLTEDFDNGFALRSENAAAARLLALGHAGARAGEILQYVDHDNYAWEKLATWAFRAACAAFARDDRSSGGAVARMVVQTGPSQEPFPSPNISAKLIPPGAIRIAEIDSELHGTFLIRHSGAAVDDILLNWSSESNHWRERYMGAGIVASAEFGRTVDPVNQWLSREQDPDVRSQLFRALGAAHSQAAAQALLERYCQYGCTEGKHGFSTSVWRCDDSDEAIKLLEGLLKEDVENYPASIVSLARLRRRHPDIDSFLGSTNFFTRANAALAMGYLREEKSLNRLRSQLREAAAPIERICVAVALRMIAGPSMESTLHAELVGANDHNDIVFRIDPYFLFPYLKEAIWDAFNSDTKVTPTVAAWDKELLSLPGHESGRI